MFEVDAVLQNIAGHADVVLRRFPDQQQTVFFDFRLDGDISRRGHVLDGESLRVTPFADIFVFVDGADFAGVLADRQFADVQHRLARFQNLAVVELDFVLRHFAGVVHAGIPRKRRLVLAVRDRDGKPGHLFRRRRVLDREADLRLLARISFGVVGDDIGGLLADSEIAQNGGGGRGFDRLVATGHDVFRDAAGVVLAGEREMVKV